MNIHNISEIILKYVSWIVPIPLLIAVLRKKHLNKDLKIIFFFLVNSLIFEFVSRTMRQFKIPNLYLFHLYVLTESFFIFWFYYELFKKNISPKIIPTIYLLFIVFSLIDTFVWHNPFTFNSYAKTLECLIIVCYTIFYLYKTFDEFQDEDPSETSIFWINAGFLFYFSGCLFLFSFSDFMLSQEKSMRLIAWAVHAFFIIIMYSLISIGLWKSKRQ